MLLAPILEVLIDVSARRVTLVMESHVAVRLIIFYLQSTLNLLDKYTMILLRQIFLDLLGQAMLLLIVWEMK